MKQCPKCKMYFPVVDIFVEGYCYHCAVNPDKNFEAKDFDKELEKVSMFTSLQAKGFIVGNLKRKYTNEGCREDCAITIANIIVKRLIGV